MAGPVLINLAPTAAQAASPRWAVVKGGSPTPKANQLLLNTTCSNAWDCWTVGAILPDSQNAKPKALAEHWNGSSWSVTPGVQPSARAASILYDVSCVTSSDCWGVGGEQTLVAGNDPTVLMERWNGVRWSVATTTPSVGGLLFSVSCVAASDCWSVGSTLNPTSGSTDRSLAFHWNGSSWARAAIPASGQNADQLSSVNCIDATDCWAVGAASPNPFNSDVLPDLFYKSQGAEPWVLHWDGSTWSGSTRPDPQSATGAVLTGVTCLASTDCWAVGSTMNTAGHFDEPLAERWDGTTWAISPIPIAANGTLAHVTCLSADACWAVGASSVPPAGGQQGSNPQNLIERWDGRSWSEDGGPVVTPVSDLDGVTCWRGAQCFATGFVVSTPDQFAAQTLIEQLSLPAAGSQGFEAVAADGEVFNLGDTGFYGSMNGHRLVAPTVGTAATPDGGGYWLVAADGGIFAFGDAGFYGSMGGSRLDAPVVGMAATPDGAGYWLVAADGGIFSFGDARFYGSMGGTRLDGPIVGMAATPDGGGYWLVAADGGIFAFGDARFFGSMGGARLDGPMVGMAATPDGGGYWLVAADGGVFAFGDAGFYGSMPDKPAAPDATVAGMTVSPDGRGYWLVGANGKVYSYGDAIELGTPHDLGLRAPLTGVSPSE